VIAHRTYQLAMRARALTLSVATTGSVQLSATATGYARTTGSFLTDGFLPGMDLVGTSFTNAVNNAAKTIKTVSALALACDGCTVESAGTRTLTVGLPTIREWENSEPTPTAPVPTRPYVREQYLPGAPARQITLGPLGQLEALPVYELQLFLVPKLGILAARAYADGLLALFPPRLALSVPAGDSLQVRSDSGPSVRQLLQDPRGWAVLPVTIPFRVRTPNSL